MFRVSLGLGLGLGLDWVVHYFLDFQKLRNRYSANRSEKQSGHLQNMSSFNGW